jgi:asparagine synthase (glutamine-hydrolysing)
MAGVPANLKLRGKTTKYLMKLAMRKDLPRKTLHGAKRGFNVPMPGWLAADLRSFVGDVLAPDRIGASGLFRPEVVSRLVDEHLKRRVDHSRTLWSLIVIEHWIQQHAVAPRGVETWAGATLAAGTPEAVAQA